MASPPDFSSTEHRLLDDLVEAARQARAEGLVVSTSGNFSARLEGNRFAISATRTRLGHLSREDLVVLGLDGDETRVGGGGRERGERPSLGPSRETPLHLALYRSYPDLLSILHFQSLAATVLACRGEPLPDLNFLPEFSVYVRRAALVPYLPPGGEALALAAVEAFQDPDVRVAQLANHGQVVVGESPAQAVERGVFFEFACRLFLLSENRGPLRRFDAEELKVLRSY